MGFEPPPSVLEKLSQMDGDRAAAAIAGIPFCETHRIPHEETDLDFVCPRCEAEKPPPVNQETLFGVTDDPQSGTVKFTLPDPGQDTVGKFHAGAGRTEVAAAVKTLPGTGTQRGLILAAVAAAADGLIDEEIGAVAGVADTAHRTRRNELVTDGWLVDSGRTRLTGSGTESIVWVLSDAARALR